MGFRTSWGIIGIPSLSVDADFPTAISCHIWHNWPPAYRQSIPVQCVRVCAQTWRCLRITCQALQFFAGLRAVALSSYEDILSAKRCGNCWHSSISALFFFTRLELEILRKDVPYLIVGEEHRNNRFMLWKCSAGTEICHKGRNVIQKDNPL